MRVLMSLLLLGMLVGAQDAEQLEQFTEMFDKAVEAGGLEAILDHIPEGAQLDFTESPGALRRMAESGARWARKHAKNDADTWRRLIEFMETCANGIPEEDAGTADVRAARAEIALCRARVNAVTDEPFRKEDWTAAADLFLKLHGDDPDGGKYLARATQALEEGARAGGDDAADLRQRASTLLLDGAGKYPANKYFATARHRAQLEMIDLTLKRSPAEAKKMMTAYLGSIQAASIEEVNTAYNDAVTFARKRKKLGLKPKYTAESVRISLVNLKIPISSRWKKKGSRIYQYDTAGNLMRTIRFREYKWTSNYYLGAHNYGGDNIKGLARIGEADVLEEVLDVKYQRKLRRGRLSRAIPSAQMFEIGGLDKDGDYLCYRWYYFKCKKTKLRSLKVAILDVGEYKKLGPEAAYVLSTIRE